MKRSDFAFDLPPEAIALRPASERDGSRLMVLDRATGERAHRRFSDLTEYLAPGDCLVLNSTRVFSARLFGTKDATGARIELLLLRETEPDLWACLALPARKLRPGDRLTFADDLTAEVVGPTPDGDGGRLVRLIVPSGGDVRAAVERVGHTPLPPYIRREADDDDKARYQTVYADGPAASVAAPTAGLHFTPALLERIRQMGVTIVTVTLHVGLGTFRPVEVDDLAEHKMSRESYEISPETADAVNRTRAAGGRIVAVGTTSVRCLESNADESGVVTAGAGWTEAFFYPPYRFRVVDRLVTNFHMPESTLVMLVSAFAGREQVLEAYREAIRLGYRFYSYGDAMLIV